jgi:hypothetical protein
MWFLVLCLVAIGAIAIDHSKDGIFPDRVYCDFGAGKMYVTRESSVTRPTSWSIGTQTVDSEGNVYRAPDRPNQYTTTYNPGSSTCVHTTLWDGWDLTGERKKREEAERLANVEEQKRRDEAYARERAIRDESNRIARAEEEERLAKIRAENAARDAVQSKRGIGAFFSDPPLRR